MTRFLSLALAAAVLVGCDASAPDNPAAPALISAAAFDLNANAFPNASGRVAAGANHLNAAARVSIVSVVVGLNLVLPSAATVAATRNSPTVTDGVWAWEATVTGVPMPVDLRLEGEPSGSQIGWRLVTAREGEAPFTYYTASTGLDGKTGSWTLFHPNETSAVLSSTFDVRDFSNREVTFRVPPGHENSGSSVRYAVSGTQQTFDWLGQPGSDRALIVWDRESRAGSITADSYNGGVRACWDENLNDVAC